jgi:DNA-binding NarL/FixJ family response regulator
MCIGVAVASPLLSLGVVSIVEDALGLQAIELHRAAVATAARDLTAVVLDGRCVLEDLCDLVVRLRKRAPHLKVLAIGWPLTAEEIQKLVRAGLKGYLLDTSGEAEVRMALDVVLDGSIWAPRKVLARLIDEGATLAQTGAVELPLEELSARELEVMNLLISGRSNREIGAALGIEPATVKAHLSRMLRKTRSKNRLEMTLRTLEHHLDKPER